MSESWSEMTRLDLERLGLDPGAAISRTDFLESYGNTTGLELEVLSGPNGSPEGSDGRPDVADEQWMLTMDAASALREAGSWALYFDVSRAVRLLNRAGRLYQSAGMAFGSFLLTIAGFPELDDLLSGIQLLAQIHDPDYSRGTPTPIPDALRHPQQQAYLFLACAGMMNMPNRFDTSEDRRLGFQQALYPIAAESPVKQGVLPFGALGTPIRIPWDIGVHLLQERSPDSLRIVARHLAAMCRRFAETMELATVNDYLWSHAAAPVETGDIDVIGMAVLASIHFGSDELATSLGRLGVRDEDEGLAFIPMRLARELTNALPRE
jgi:hypothetical protein